MTRTEFERSVILMNEPLMLLKAIALHQLNIMCTRSLLIPDCLSRLSLPALKCWCNFRNTAVGPSGTDLTLDQTQMSQAPPTTSYVIRSQRQKPKQYVLIPQKRPLRNKPRSGQLSSFAYSVNGGWTSCKYMGSQDSIIEKDQKFQKVAHHVVQLWSESFWYPNPTVENRCLAVTHIGSPSYKSQPSCRSRRLPPPSASVRISWKRCWFHLLQLHKPSVVSLDM